MSEKHFSEKSDGFGLPAEMPGALFEMANIRKTTTGLPVNIWVSPRPQGWRKGLRIKVANLYSNSVDPDATFSLFFDGDEVKAVGDTGEISGRDLESVRAYFLKHRDIFQLLWDKQIDDDEFKRLIARAAK